MCDAVKSASVLARYKMDQNGTKPVFEKSHADFLPRASKSVKSCSPPAPQHKLSRGLVFRVFLVCWRSSVCPFHWCSMLRSFLVPSAVAKGKNMKEPFDSPVLIHPFVSRSTCFRVFHVWFLYHHLIHHLFLYGAKLTAVDELLPRWSFPSTSASWPANRQSERIGNWLYCKMM